MRGQIANFSPQQGQGIIMAEDGKNYPFTSQQWQQATAPMAGQQVEFSVDAQGYAVAVVGAYFFGVDDSQYRSRCSLFA